MDVSSIDSSVLLQQSADLVTRYAFDLAGAVVILVVGWIIAGWASAATGRAADRSGRVDETLRPFLVRLVRYLILIFVLLAVLAQFGIETTSIIAILGAAGLAIGLALQGTLSNIAAGLMLLVLRPFNVGDYIDAGGVGGTVTEIGLFLIHLKTADGVFVSVPNSQIWNSTITNYSRLPTRRLDIAVGIGYGDDLGKAVDVLRSMLDEDGRVLREPVPEVMVKELGDSAVVLNLRAWANAGDYWALYWDLNREVKLRLDREGISIPFPQRDVHLVDDGAPAAGARKKRGTA